PTPIRKDVSRLLFRLKRMAKGDSQTAREVQRLYTQVEEENRQRFNSHLYSQSANSALEVREEPAIYAADAPILNGYEILNRYFDGLFAARPEVFAFGEDVGKIGDVNQG